jgi:hypothetical protein
LLIAKSRVVLETRQPLKRLKSLESSPLLFLIGFSSTMASSIAESVREVGDSVADSVINMGENKKIADLQRNTKDQHSKQNTTTDYGSKIPDLDHWLKTVDDKNQKVGPHLLEDHTGRERVCSPKSLAGR